ncbi:Cold shock-like protein CspE [Pseudomonas fluorescens]|uniref:Cold shock-like protein CspE n=2 Tax=Pseudomonas fluorescens TaxID=294 RepID=A0A5E6QH60_PSEFL|nr:Cold shock-like protein CspE [Pseudomonas fluorescens]
MRAIEMAITKGTVKFFNESKGYGFITPEDGSKDVFAHSSEIKVDGFKTLAEGQRVEFEIKDVTGKGLSAVNIHPI